MFINKKNLVKALKGAGKITALRDGDGTGFITDHHFIVVTDWSQIKETLIDLKIEPADELNLQNTYDRKNTYIERGGVTPDIIGVIEKTTGNAITDTGLEMTNEGLKITSKIFYNEKQNSFVEVDKKFLNIFDFSRAADANSEIVYLQDTVYSPIRIEVDGAIIGLICPLAQRGDFSWPAVLQYYRAAHETPAQKTA
jgi:hypothetical protein